MKKNKFLWAAIVVLLCGLMPALVSLGGTVPEANALSQDLVTKSQMYSVYQCYKNGNMRSPIESWEYRKGEVSAGGKGPSVLGTTGMTVSLLTTTTGIANYTSCSNLFSDILKSKVPSADTSSTELESFMKKMGYTADKSGDGGVCATYNFAGSSSGSLQICAPAASTEEPYTLGNSTITVNRTNAPILVEVGKYLGHPHLSVRCGSTMTSKVCGEVSTSSDSSFDTIAQSVFNIIGDYVNDNSPGWYLSGSQASIGSAGEKNRFTLDNPSSGAVSAINYLFGKNLTSEAQIQPTISLSLAEQQQAIQEALNDYFHVAYFGGSESSACNISGTAKDNAVAQGFIELKVNTSTTCYAKATTHTNDKLPLYNLQTKMPDASLLGFSDVVTAAKNYIDGASSIGETPSLSLTPTDPGTNPTTPGTDGDGTDGGTDATTIEACYQAAASLGWFLCPVIKAVSGATAGLYTVIIEPFLGISSSIMEYGGNGTYHGWTQFRNFANILFAIAFGVIILAQVTGIGVSNYNIKKILPRFIMVVILVNVSFILCQLAVDVSNILGYSLRNMFESMAHTVTIPQGEGLFSLDKLIPFIVGSLFTTTLVGGAAVIGVLTWEVWLIPFLIGLLGCVIGVFFFFIILGVRQAGVVILVAIAPVAIVCYALPNTKSIFDKWKKLFTALILVYPICGALMGAGQYASALLLAAGGDQQGAVMFFYYLTAMLVSVAPFFMIPSIVKGSMAAMGSLGMRISNFGKGFGNTVGRAARNSDFGKDSQRRLEMRNAERAFNRVGRKAAKIEAHNAKVAATGRGKTKTLSSYDQLSRSRASMRYNRLAMEDVKAGSTEELLKPGSARWTSLTQRQQDEMISGRQQLYESGAESGVDINNLSTVANEYEAQLDKLDAAITSGSVADKETALANVKALQNILSKTDKGRGLIQDKMQKRLSEHQEYADGSHDNQETAISLAAGHIMEKHADTYKKTNRGLHAMVQDLSGRQYSRGFSVPGGAGAAYGALRDARGNVVVDRDGNPVGYRSAFYDRLGTSKYNAQSLAGADDSAIRRLRENTSKMTNTELSDLTSTIDQILSNPSVAGSLQPEVKRELQQILSSGAARGAVGRSVDPSRATFGSSVMAQASTSSLDNMIGRIRDTNSQTQMSADEVRNVAENARRALETDSGVNNPEVADRLQQVLAAARARNVQDLEGNDFNPVDPSSMYIRHGAPQAQPQPPTQTQPPATPPIITVDGDASMDRIRDMARNNPGPRQRQNQNNPNRNDGDGPRIIIP